MNVNFDPRDVVHSNGANRVRNFFLVQLDQHILFQSPRQIFILALGTVTRKCSRVSSDFEFHEPAWFVAGIADSIGGNSRCNIFHHELSILSTNGWLRHMNRWTVNCFACVRQCAALIESMGRVTTSMIIGRLRGWVVIRDDHDAGWAARRGRNSHRNSRPMARSLFHLR